MYIYRMKTVKYSVLKTLCCGTAALLFFSCGSSNVEPAPVKAEENPVVVEEKQTPPAADDPVPEPVVQNDADDEYSRSVGAVSVSRDTFAEDKARILKIIEDLSKVMRDMDYKSWLTYVDAESINYYSQSSNLKKAQSRLPVKGLKLNNLQDYFKYVFVPARRDRTVTEIRYISDKYIKAIQVQENQDIVYYYFNKINGYWMVHIPPIE